MTRVKQFVLDVDRLLPLLLLLPIGLALLPGGLPNTSDGPVHFIRAAEMVHAWQDGILLPRWSANLGNGYGLPLFVYAPPLPYYLIAFIQTWGLSLEVAFKGTLLIALLSAAFGAYHLNRALLGRWPGAVGAVAYLYAPILLRELFIQGNLPQLLAWTFAPWSCYGIIQLFRIGYLHTGRLRAGLLVALAVMGTMLSHNAVALLLAGTVGGLTLSLWLFTRRGRALWIALASTLLGLGLSAWFWLPALLEGDYVQLGRIVASDFRPRFIPLAELLAFSPRLDTGAINPFFPLTLGGIQVWMGLVGILCLFLSFPILRGKRQQLDPLTYGATLFFALLAVFCGFMATAWSEPVWRILPFVNLFEWPFRWHGFTLLGLSWSCAFTLFAITRSFPRLTHSLGALSLLLLIGSALVNLYPNKLPLGTLTGSPADVVRFETHTGQIGTTSLGEFDPTWAYDTLASLPPPDDYRQQRPVNRLPRHLPAGAHGVVQFSDAQTQRFALTLPSPLTLTLELLYFPGWQAAVDGVPVATTPHPGNGLLDVRLPAGEHQLTLHFGETPLRWRADLISLFAWLGLILFMAWGIAQTIGVGKGAKGQRGRVNKAGVALEPGLPIVASVVACIALLSGVYLLTPDLFRVHSQADQALPATKELHVDFGHQLRLLGVDPPPTVVAAGDTVTIVTYWRALQRLPTNYAIFLHVDTPNGQTLATVDQTHPGNIPTSSWAPSLYVRVPLRLTIPANLPPIRYQLRVGMMDPQTGAWLSPVGKQGDVLDIGQLWVEPRSPISTSGKPRAWFGATIQLLDVRYDRTTQNLTLLWQTNAPIAKDYKIFVHALTANGTLLGQSDATPYQDQYPTSAWRPQQIIEDQRSLKNIVPQPDQLNRFAIGLYDLTSAERLPALDEAGKPLADNALIVDLTSVK